MLKIEQTGGCMDKYTVYFNDRNIQIEADSWDIDNYHNLSFYEMRKVIACFNMANIAGFKKLDSLEELKKEAAKLSIT